MATGTVRRYAAAGLLSGLIATSPAVAGDDEAKALLDRFVNEISSMSATFEQSLVDADDIVIESSRGTMQIRRPGQFRWTYSEPYVQILVADGLNVWSYDVNLEQVTVKPQADVLANTPALLLGGTRQVLDEFEFVDSSTDRGTVWIRLRPKNTDNGFSEVELGFTGGELSRMMFADNLQQTTLIALLDVSVNQSIDDAMFEFSVPDGADLVGVPVVADQTGM